MEKKELFGKISNYYSGEENGEIIKEELEHDEETKELFHWIDLFWNKLNPRRGYSASIQLRTHRKIEKTLHPAPLFRLRMIKYAAVILLVLGLGGITYFLSVDHIRMVEITSGIGEVKEIRLPDGSKAWLNVQSALIYPEVFDKKKREVVMTGEVYFEVKHDPGQPFIVNSEQVKVSVLGTSFLISNYDDDPTVDTYLAEGSIELELKQLQKSIKLIPGDEVSFNKEILSVTRVNNPNSLLDSWRFGKLIFYNESLFEIARKLERKFGKEIKIQDENIGNKKYTADFESEDLEQILNFFKEVSSVKYQPTTNGYLITKR